MRNPRSQAHADLRSPRGVGGGVRDACVVDVEGATAAVAVVEFAARDAPFGTAVAEGCP
jgi:hypothetical protein